MFKAGYNVPPPTSPSTSEGYHISIKLPKHHKQVVDFGTYDNPLEIYGTTENYKPFPGIHNDV